MSNRIASLNQIANASRTNFFNTYIPGTGVGSISRSNRQVLYRKASLNPGTMKNPKQGRCNGFCINLFPSQNKILNAPQLLI